MTVTQETIGRHGWFTLVAGAAIIGIMVLFQSLSAGAVTGVLLVVSGLCAILAGSRETVTVGSTALTWHQLAGLSYALLAPALPLIFLPAVLAGTAATAEIAVFVITTLGGVALAFMGYDLYHGGKHFAIEPVE